jgi:DNA-directed RNA polymerase III subunit RPC7
MQPTLSRKDLHQPFFPQEIFEDYFNPKRKKKSEKFILLADINILLHGGNF